MHKITFTCETITPMFLAGADGSTPELRAPSIKGALRFWWRALNGHLSLGELKEREGEIFGNTERRSMVIIICKNNIPSVKEYRMVAHKGNSSNSSEIRQELKITLKLVRNINSENGYTFNFDKLKALFEVFCFLGGLGRRARRANGQLKIITYKANNSLEPFSSLSFGQTLVDKLNLLSLDSNQPFSLDNSKNMIKANFSNTQQLIPHIYSIEKIVLEDDKNCEDLRFTISNATHISKSKEYKQDYSKYIGSGSPRFASPIIFSIVEGNTNPYILITKLKTVKSNKIISSSAVSSIQKALVNEIKTN
jgi:CRISPR-associated protein Cmr1